MIDLIIDRNRDPEESKSSGCYFAGFTGSFSCVIVEPHVDFTCYSGAVGIAAKLALACASCGLRSLFNDI